MEQIIITCLEAQLLMGRVQTATNTSLAIKVELLSEILRVSPKTCFVDEK
jgi:hypothetical protein